jgi:hypothetical protein
LFLLQAIARSEYHALLRTRGLLLANQPLHFDCELHHCRLRDLADAREVSSPDPTVTKQIVDDIKVALEAIGYGSARTWFPEKV